MRRLGIVLATATLSTVLLAGGAGAREVDFPDAPEAGRSVGTGGSADGRLMIVNGNSGHVIYDDGRDDLYCVTRRVTVGYDYYGRPVRRRTMNCR